MCGVVAVISKYKNGFISDQTDIFEHLLLVDTIRGFDSTGTFLVNLNGDVNIAKEASTGGTFLQHKEWKNLRSQAIRNGACLIGHNRKATKGVINDENAHPFYVEDKIVLVHNGGIFGEHKQHANVEVDSHAIAHLLAKHENIEDALGEFHGAYAMMWYDVEKEELNIIRNKERPMWFMETTDSWIWASERTFLAFACNRVGVKMVEGGEPRPLEEDSLNKFSLKDRQWVPSYRKLVPNRKYTQVGNVGGGNNSSLFLNDEEYDAYPQWSQAEHPLDRTKNDWELAMDAANKYRNKDCCPPKETKDGLPSPALDKVFVSTVGGDNFAKTSDFERELAIGTNRRITAAEFNQDVCHSYLWMQEVACSAFEYSDDGEGGFFVYASPEDDPQVLFRHHFTKETKADEKRIMNMALGNYKLKLKVATKAWSPFFNTGKPDRPTAEGYCVIISGGCEIMEGGGIKQDKKDTADAK